MLLVLTCLVVLFVGISPPPPLIYLVSYCHVHHTLWFICPSTEANNKETPHYFFVLFFGKIR